MEEIISNTIQKYLNARNELISLGHENPDLFSGNDNMIGRIGEYLAILFLREYLDQDPIKAELSNQKGFDLVERNNIALRTQVKMITSENKKGRTVRLEYP